MRQTQWSPERPRQIHSVPHQAGGPTPGGRGGTQRLEPPAASRGLDLVACALGTWEHPTGRCWRRMRGSLRSSSRLGRKPPRTTEPGGWWRLSSTEQRAIIQFWRPSVLHNYPSQFTDFTITDAEPVYREGGLSSVGQGNGRMGPPHLSSQTHCGLASAGAAAAAGRGVPPGPTPTERGS